LIVCAAGVWFFVAIETRPDKDELSASPSGPVIAQVTTMEELPAITKSGQFPAVWSGIVGLKATPVEAQTANSDQRPFRITAVPTNGGHYLSVRISSLKQGEVYAAEVLLKPDSQTLVFLQVHDQKASNYGLLLCDLAARAIYGVQRDVISQQIQPVEGGWLKLTLALRSADGSLDVTLGFVDPPNRTVFKGDGRSTLTFGGVEMVPQS
jgi:hypothetical protein